MSSTTQAGCVTAEDKGKIASMKLYSFAPTEGDIPTGTSQYLKVPVPNMKVPLNQVYFMGITFQLLAPASSDFSLVIGVGKSTSTSPGLFTTHHIQSPDSVTTVIPVSLLYLQYIATDYDAIFFRTTAAGVKLRGTMVNIKLA